MNKFRYLLYPIVWIILSMPWLMAQICQTGTTCVLTQHNDVSRTGQNLQETILNTANVNVTDFGEVLSIPVTGNIFAQPLYVSNLSIAGGHNVLYVATAENYVYAFDADTGATLWSLGQNALGTPVPSQDICVTDRTECPYTDVIPDLGILATPVIDPATQTMYVVANTKASGSYHFFLHALDITSGAEKFGGPTEIITPGITQLTEMSRPGLLLANGMVYLAMGSVGDFPTWHGYVMAYDGNTLQQVAVFNSTSQNNNVGGAGIWQSGNGLVADANGDVYAVTSNGNFDVITGGKDYGSAYLRLSGSTLSVLDYFVPYNQASLNPESDNVDLGSGGPLLIPNSTLLVGTGKDAVLRVVDTTNMGKYNPSKDQNLQGIKNATNAPVLGSPVYWNSPSLGPSIYLWGLADVLKAWSFNGQELNTAPISTGTIAGAPSDVAALSISADGNTSGTGILWATRPISGASNPGPTAGIVYAFDANDPTRELWDSQQNSTRDALGNWAKFNPPTVANGKVYVPTFCAVSAPGCSGQLVVYGLIATPDFSVSVSPSTQSVNPGSSASYIVYVSPQAGFNGTVTLACSGLPSGITCSPASASIAPGTAQQVSVPLTVTTSASTANSTYAFSVTATSGSLAHSIGASLSVGAGSGNASFTLTPTQLSPSTIMAGSSATSKVTVAPVGNFNSTVNLSCSIAPATSTSPTCSLSSSVVSGANGTVTLTVNTLASTALRKSKQDPIVYYAMLFPLCGIALLGTSSRVRRHLFTGALLALVLVSLVYMTACGGGSTGGGGGGGGTTPGNYSVTVTGTSGTASQITTLSVTVQ